MLMLLVSLVLVVPSHARDREVSVSGSCLRTVTPDRGAIVLTAEAQDKDLKAAAKDATEAYERAKKAVERLGLADLELRTVEYSLNEVREWEKNKTVSKGFRARMGLRVASSQIQRLGEVIAIGAREGLRDVGALVSFLSEEKQKKEQFECLKEAAEDARARAEKMAGALGAKVGEVVMLSESGGYQRPEPQPRAMLMEKSMAANDMAAPTVEAGRQDLHVTVQATFSLK